MRSERKKRHGQLRAVSVCSPPPKSAKRLSGVGTLSSPPRLCTPHVPVPHGVTSLVRVRIRVRVRVRVRTRSDEPG